MTKLLKLDCTAQPTLNTLIVRKANKGVYLAVTNEYERSANIVKLDKEAILTLFDTLQDVLLEL